jgi:hypothetical protein
MEILTATLRAGAITTWTTEVKMQQKIPEDGTKFIIQILPGLVPKEDGDQLGGSDHVSHSPQCNSR